tara:strand:+ start:9727 stop:11895 length:2169 start_codon:yes stop_codon:yes gene_type:complete
MTSSRKEEFEKKKQQLRNQLRYGGTGVPITVVNTDGTESTYAPGSQGYADVYKPGGSRDQAVGNSNAVVQTKTTTNNTQNTQTRVVDENPSRVNLKDGQVAYGSVKVDGKALRAQMESENAASELNNILSKATEDQANRGVTEDQDVDLSRVVEVEKTPAPPNLSDEQVDTAKDLIKANPPGEKAQEQIKTLKEKYPEELKDVESVKNDELTPKEKEKRDKLIASIEACEKPDSITVGRTIMLADPCKDNTFDEMQAQLENFFSKITGPGNAILNMSNEIKNISNIMSGTMSGFVNKMTGAVNDKLQGLISKGMSKLSSGIFAQVTKAFPYSAALSKVTKIQEGLMGPVSALLDGIFCVGKKIIGAMGGVISDLISAAIPKITNPVPCAVQQIIGAINNKVINMIDSVTGSLLGPVTKVLGFAFSAKSFLSGGINILSKFGSLINCASGPKCPPSNKFVIGKGIQKGSSVSKAKKNFDKVFSGTALTQAVANKATDFEKEYGSWEVFGSPLANASNANPCNTGNPTSCGGAFIEIFGGDGIGGSGRAVLGNFIRKFDKDDLFGEIQRTASIVGVEVTNPGSGYTSDPIVTIDDECDQGRGAYAQAHVDKNPNSPTYGQITSFTMITPGVNYPAQEEETELFIDRVIIQDPGNGYENTDTLDNFDLNIINGQIVSGSLVNQIAYDDLPELNIDSETGVGAILRPVMSKRRPQGEIVKVIDCVS